MQNYGLPTLYGVASTKKIKQWKIEALQTEEGYGLVRTSHGYIDGKIQTNDRVIKKGKNIGKSNETTPYEQAISEATSKWNAKKDENYQEEIPDPNDSPNNILPMLAMDYHKRKHNIVLPAFCQPKLNGVRCLAIKEAEGVINFQSRKGKSYNDTLQHLVEPLNKAMLIGEIFDGEIYHHGWLLQRIVSAVKKVNEDTPKLEFWLYDVALDKLEFNNRLFRLLSDVAGKYKRLVVTKTVIVYSEDDIKLYHDEYIADGFEGAIIRNKNGLYKFDNRSKDLQKYKEFIDDEFTIIGGEEGTGLEEGCVIFICENEDGKPFKVRPKGTREMRAEWFQNIDSIIGKQLTVRYKERTADNIPVPPVGIAIRDYE